MYVLKMKVMLLYENRAAISNLCTVVSKFCVHGQELQFVFCSESYTIKHVMYKLILLVKCKIATAMGDRNTSMIVSMHFIGAR